MPDNPSEHAFIERAYRDVFDLLVALRDYVEGAGRAESDALASDDRLQLTYELSRLTRQLTNVMAWLMLQKAVIAGEMTAEQAAADSAATMDFDPVEDAPDDPAARARLPIAARGLLDRGARLVAHACTLAGRKTG